MHSPISYFGGKSRLAKKIVRLIPKHVTYVEPFCGAAWIFWTKPESKVEILNDLDGELVNFWRIVQNHVGPFLDYYKHAVISRELFEIEKRKDPTTLTDLQRAARYYYLQRLGFGGKTDDQTRTFGSGATRPMNLNLITMEETIMQAHWRLQRVTIEHLDACACIERYDRPETFFYVDPPYFGVSQDYAVKFNGGDFLRLRDTLKKIAGRFILSLNDCVPVRKLFAGFRMDRVLTKYSSGNSRIKATTRSIPRAELLISNWEKK